MATGGEASVAGDSTDNRIVVEKPSEMMIFFGISQAKFSGLNKKGRWDVPSGKHLHNYGKSPFLMGKLTINDHFQ